jgi:putative aldouronate transport system permease protein
MQTTSETMTKKSSPAVRAPRLSGRSMLWRQIKRGYWTYLLLLPGLLYFLGFLKSTWVGWDNFVSVFQDPEFGTVISNTLIISLLQIIFAFPAGIILALMLNALLHDRFKRFMQSVLYLPHFIGWVIIISIWQQIFGGDGMLNHLVTGLGGHPINIMTNPDFFKPLVVLQVVWKETGWSTILFIAAITGIDLSLYEAAVMDGANKWRRTWHITLPGIRGVIVLLLILRIGNILSTGFEQIFLQRDAVGLNAAEVIDTFVYDRGIINGNWGLAAAIALLKTIIGAVLVYSANRIAKQLGEDGLY